MTDKLKQALESANRLSQNHGLNVRGNSYALLERAIEDRDLEDNPDLSEVYDIWFDVCQDVLDKEDQECSGRMSSMDIAILREASKDLIDIALSECSSWEELKSVLSLPKAPEELQKVEVQNTFITEGKFTGTVCVTLSDGRHHEVDIVFDKPVSEWEANE